MKGGIKNKMVRNPLKKREPEVPELPEVETPQPAEAADPTTYVKEIFADPGQQILNDKLNHIITVLHKFADDAEIKID